MTDWLKKDVHCVLEVTGAYYMRLALHLHRPGFKLSVVNPLVIKWFSQMRLIRAKTDKADARMIAQYGLSEELECWNPAAQYIVTLTQLDNISIQLQKHHAALNSQLESFAEGGMLEKEARQFLMKFLKSVQQKQLQIEKKIDAIITSYHSEMLQQLTSIPGLGKKTAAILIVITDGFEKFNFYKQLSAFVGICPRILNLAKQ